VNAGVRNLMKGRLHRLLDTEVLSRRTVVRIWATLAGVAVGATFILPSFFILSAFDIPLSLVFQAGHINALLFPGIGGFVGLVAGLGWPERTGAFMDKTISKSDGGIGLGDF